MPVSDGGKPQLLLPAHCWSVAAWGLLPVLPFGGTWGSLLKAGLRRGAGASPSPPPPSPRRALLLSASLE